MSDDSSEEKTDEASSRKLRKLREDGIVASSQIGPSYFGLAFGIGVAILLFPTMLSRLTDGFDLVFDPRMIQSPTDTTLIQYFLVTINVPVAVVIATIVVAAVGFKIMVNGGFVFAMSHVAPKLSHVSPATGLKRIFKASSLTDFAGHLVRMIILLTVGLLIMRYWMPVLTNLDMCAPECASSVFWEIVRSFLVACAVLILAAVAFDVGVQKAFFLIEQRMTKTEVKQEQKEMLGQPELRQERKRLQKDTANLAGNVGLNVATAYFTYGDRVVALVFDPVKTPLPKVAAKSRQAKDTIKMVHTLQSRNVPGVEDETIVATCEVLPVGSNIPRKIFLPVATHLRGMLG